MASSNPNAITCLQRLDILDIQDGIYIPMARGFVYLAAVIDWHSWHVLAWRLSISMDTALCTEAVEEASARYGKPEIFNTDQGSQFTSQGSQGSQFTSSAFTGLLLDHGIRISMDGKGCWRDNVFIERVWPLDQVRGGLPACLRDSERGARRHRPRYQLLQHAPAALEPSSSNPGRAVLRSAASAFGRSSLTPQGPLINLGNLFRSTGPALSCVSGLAVASPGSRCHPCASLAWVAPPFT